MQVNEGEDASKFRFDEVGNFMRKVKCSGLFVSPNGLCAAATDDGHIVYGDRRDNLNAVKTCGVPSHVCLSACESWLAYAVNVDNLDAVDHADDLGTAGKVGTLGNVYLVDIFEDDQDDEDEEKRSPLSAEVLSSVVGGVSSLAFDEADSSLLFVASAAGDIARLKIKPTGEVCVLYILALKCAVHQVFARSPAVAVAAADVAVVCNSRHKTYKEVDSAIGSVGVAICAERVVFALGSSLSVCITDLSGGKVRVLSLAAQLGPDAAMARFGGKLRATPQGLIVTRDIERIYVIQIIDDEFHVGTHSTEESCVLDTFASGLIVWQLDSSKRLRTFRLTSNVAAAKEKRDVSHGRKNSPVAMLRSRAKQIIESNTPRDLDLEEFADDLKEDLLEATRRFGSKTKDLLLKTKSRLQQVAAAARDSDLDSNDDRSEEAEIVGQIADAANFIRRYKKPSDVDSACKSRASRLSASLRQLASNADLCDNAKAASVAAHAIAAAVSLGLAQDIVVEAGEEVKVEEMPTVNDFGASSFFPLESHTSDLRILRVLFAFEPLLDLGLTLASLPEGATQSWFRLVQLQARLTREALATLPTAHVARHVEDIVQGDMGNGSKAQDKIKLLSYLTTVLSLNVDRAGQLFTAHSHRLGLVDVFLFHLVMVEAERDQDLEAAVAGVLEAEASASDRFLAILNDWDSEELRRWLSSHDLIQTHVRTDFVGSSSGSRLWLPALGTALSDLLPSAEAKVSFCKEARFWTGYVKALKEADVDIRWRELSSILEMTDGVAVASSLGLLDTAESCGAVVKARTECDQNKGVKWDDLAMAVVEALGPTKATEVLLANAKQMNRGDLSQSFYHELIQRSLFGRSQGGLKAHV